MNRNLIFEYTTQAWYEYDSGVFYLITDVPNFFSYLIREGLTWDVRYSHSVRELAGYL
jgi:hypothetical protein